MVDAIPGFSGTPLLVPIPAVSRKFVGALVLGEKRSEDLYTNKDKTALAAIAQQTGLILENFWLLTRLKSVNECIRR